MRKQLIIGLLISLICLYFAFRGLSIREIAEALQKADLRWIGVALAIYSGGFMLRALRWEKLMKPIKAIPAAQLLRPMIIGFFANNVLPFRMGELARAHVAGQKFGISRTASLGTIVLERICDVIAFLSIFLIVALFFPFPDKVRHAAYAMGSGCALLIAALYMTSHHEARAQAWLMHLPISGKWKGKLQEAVANFTHGVSGIKEGMYVLKALLLSYLIWGIEGSTVYLIARAFPVHLTYPQAYFLTFFIGLAVTLPQAPGYVGTVELLGVTALSLLGIPRDQGLPIILTIHGTEFAFIVLLGLWATWKEGLSMSNLMSQKETAS